MGKSQSTIAYDKIKEMILHLDLLPGAKVSEPQLSEHLQISRTPIHNALLRLELEGLVNIERNKGPSIRSFSEEEIREIGCVRLSQDILSANLAAYYGNVVDFNRLYELAEACEEAARQGDIYKRIKIDNDFHLEIAKITGNTQLYRQQFALYQQIHLIQVVQYTNIPDSLSQIKYHKPLIQAIRDCDLEQIAQICCVHIKDFFHLDEYLLSFYGYKKSEES